MPTGYPDLSLSHYLDSKLRRRVGPKVQAEDWHADKIAAITFSPLADAGWPARLTEGIAIFCGFLSLALMQFAPR
jgi:hypothetical protein